MSLRKAVECIKRNKHFLISSHTNLEGDALGSELAFYLLLKKLGKSAVIVNEDDVPYGYDFLPGKDIIRRYKDNMKVPDFDCFAVLDCSGLRRTGEVYRLNLKAKKPVLNIDHHISNERFGALNWVEPDASSCAEMVYKLYKKLGIPFDKDSATLLYTGLLADSGSFRYSNTTSFTHKAAAELLRYGLDVVYIYKKVYEEVPFEDMRLLTKILPGVRREDKGKIIWCEIKSSLLRNKKLSFDLSEHILTFARAIKDMEVAVLFKENLGVKNEIRVNLRSQGAVDVNKIAQCFGGGGHKAASGATIKGKIEQVRRRVLAKIRESLK